jgi:hypothetical protein
MDIVFEDFCRGGRVPVFNKSTQQIIVIFVNQRIAAVSYRLFL